MNRLFITLAIVLVCIGCSKDTELNDTINIEDIDNPGLPIYSEWGYNTFGAYLDRDVFTSSDKEIPLKVTVDNNIVTFIFQGESGGYDDYMAVKFIFIDSTITDYNDLLTYHDKEIDLKSVGSSVVMTRRGVTNQLNLISGEMKFKRSQKLFIDDIEDRLILSGTFYFKYIDNGIPISMYEGRFDFGVTDDIFYNFK